MSRDVISSLTQTAYITATITIVLRQVPYMGEKHVVLSLIADDNYYAVQSEKGILWKKIDII